MSVLTHVLACLFGLGSWVTICGLWVELPVIVPQIPEGWYLPSYLSALIQLANVGPLCVTLAHRLCPGRLNESALIYTIVSLGAVTTFLLSFFWRETVEIAGAQRSVALFVLTFLVSVVDCTSSVTFLPFMNRLPPVYLTSYFVGEGLSGLLPALVALAQGVGVMHCVNATVTVRHTSPLPENASLEARSHASVALHSANVTTELDSTLFWNASVVVDGTADSGLVPRYQPAHFSAEAFFCFLTAMMVVCLGSFLLLNCLPCVPREPLTAIRKGSREHKSSKAEQRFMIASPGSKFRSRFGTGRYSWPEVIYIFFVLAWANALTNSILPSVQSYSCLPYGNVTYHWSATMAAVANPVACFIAMFFPRRSLFLMGILTVTGTAIGAYIMGMAALSPCPLLVDNIAGSVIIVVAWVLFVLTLSYVKVIIGLILRDEGHSALVWCGAVVQFGSMVGALTMFPLVNVYSLFQSGDPCNTRCL